MTPRAPNPGERCMFCGAPQPLAYVLVWGEHRGRVGRICASHSLRELIVGHFDVAVHADEDVKLTGFACPRCGRTSYNQIDVAEGYCGRCHYWTRSEAPLPGVEGG